MRTICAGCWILAALPLGNLGPLRAADEPARRDVHSFGRPDQVRVTHVDLDLAVDFESKVLNGSAVLTIERRPGSPPKAPLVLDTRDLTIEAVKAGAPDEEFAEVRHVLGKADPVLGSPLTIDLPEGATRVRVAYRTSPRASALQWVEPSGTAGGKRPYLYTQSQAIHARSWIPLQDSPGVRVTYTAAVRLDPPLRAIMAADPVGEPLEANLGKVTHRFRMPRPIPSYLIALAAGDLASRPLGARTGVWAEPAVVERAADEFADTEKMVTAAEARYGPYRWTRYDILVLPPSFPYGGMENPQLTFATPTVLAGDRSLVALIAHELAHSWSGNQVTGATWRDFWLNEGFTTYLERRIVEDLYGPDRAAMEWVLGKQELREELKRFEPRDEILHVDLRGRDPDEGMTRVPYEKGALFLRAIEEKVGRERFDDFLKGYFDRFAFQSITTADFEAYLRARLFPDAKPGAEPIDLAAWIHRPGLPDDAPEPKSDRFAAVEARAQEWLDRRIKAGDLGAKGWSTFEWLHFLRGLPPRLQSDRMAELDAAYQLTASGNSEIAQQWLLLGIRSGYGKALDRLESFLTSNGRRKYVMPLYTELDKTPAGRARARAIYAKARPRYHPIAVESVDKLLGSAAR